MTDVTAKTSASAARPAAAVAEPASDRDEDLAPALEVKNPFIGEDFTPRRVYPPLQDVHNDDVTPNDMMSFISASVDHSGLVGHNTNSFNDLMDRGIPAIITQMFRVDRMVKNEREQTAVDRSITSIKIQIGFSDVSVGKPMYSTFPIGRTVELYPNRARISGVPYSAPITLSASVDLTAHYADGRTETKHADIPPFQATKFPVMVRSNRCHTHNCTREALKRLEEDPNEPGGYFIAKNNEWVVDLLENIRFNSLHLHLAQAQNEVVRGEFISQPSGASGPFEHSSQIVLRYMTNGSITVEINSTKFTKIRIPFYLLYRVFGMTSDRDIVETIVFDIESTDVVTANMLQILERALHLSDKTFESLKDVLDREKIIQTMAEKIAKFLTNPSSYLNNDNAVQYLTQDLLSSLDRVLLPHMGMTPESRYRKLRFMGLILHKMFLTHMKIHPPTDRDSYRNKRVHGAGVSIAKTLKTQFNNAAIGPLLRAYKREVKNNPFADITTANMIDTFRNAMATTDLNSAMENAITAGNKTIVIKRRVATNRVSSQPLERKNFLNMICALRTITTHNSSNASKQTERADMMRRVHATYVGFIDVAHSADTGENVGMRKQMAVTASVCTPGEPVLLKMRLLADTVIPLDKISSAEASRRSLARVFVNGEWIGYEESAAKIVARYRALRRESRIDPRTTIYWDPVVDEVEFWVDGGRLVRPLIIVDSNIDEYDAACRAAHEKNDPSLRIKFIQNIRFTMKHVKGIMSGLLTLEDLLAEGIAEFITPEEQENCLIAPSIEVLHRARHRVTERYTHIDVEQAIFGLASLISPFGNHTQPARVTYETNQGRQTGGWYAASFPFRADKNRFWQFYNEVPLVRTLSHKYVLPNGLNTYMAYMSKEGDNQEDSAVVNQGSRDRMMFAGAFWRYEKAELEKGEVFGNPDALTTKNLKPGASYENLVDGFIPVGTVVRRGDILIGRYAKITRARGAAASSTTDPESKYQYVDRSVMYRQDEPAVVDAVLKPRGANDELFGLVKLRYSRPLGIGDKMSSRSGNKSIVARMVSQSDMPFTQSGLTLDILVNPHCIPSRMTIGQLIETALAKVCARKGIICDGTAFLKVSHEEMAEELARHGFRFNGRERLYNGTTGEHYDAAIFIGPVYEQRLQKFVLDDEYAVSSSGPTDATTGQPLGGKNVRGGLRLGEMEGWCLESHGAMMSLFEKYSEDSDGRRLGVCRACGNHAVKNEAYNIYKCRICGEAADIEDVESTKASIVFQEELAASNIRLKLGLRPREYEEYPSAPGGPGGFVMV